MISLQPAASAAELRGAALPSIVSIAIYFADWAVGSTTTGDVECKVAAYHRVDSAPILRCVRALKACFGEDVKADEVAGIRPSFLA